MSQYLEAFDFEENPDGVSVISIKSRLNAGCMSEGQVDKHIQVLKNELDEVGRRMKVALQNREVRSLFDETDHA